jgi:hypothetical protein
MRILYVLTLIKYVYDLEHHGDYSIAGIVFRNIQINDGIMSIAHCSVPQKDYSSASKDHKINFGTLEGMSFFVNYVMDTEEAKVFIDVLRAILSRSPRGQVRKTVCKMLASKKVDAKMVKDIELAYKSRYGTDLVCSSISSATASASTSASASVSVSNSNSRAAKLPNLSMRVESNNPVFMKDYCYNVNEVIVKVDGSQSKPIMNAFKLMQQNYKANVAGIERLMDKLVINSRNGYELRDIGKPELDVVVDDVKTTIKLFYMQSIMDFQNLLDIAKNNQSIQVNREQ